jgi:dTDP-4-amino-4,6-dideoxygalactose transaminase
MKLFETKINKKDAKVITEVIESGLLGFGQNVLEFEKGFAPFSNKKYNVSTNSASAAAFIIFSYLREKYGVCDVYTTSLGFTSPAWAAKHFEHNLYFVDVQPDLQFCSLHYKNIRKTTKNTVVVMPVLYGGVSKIDGFELVGDEIVVVDSAHCVTPTISSDFIFFSFHPYKPIGTSDGGMISTDDAAASQYFLRYRNFGRKQQGNSYDITHDGFKFYMNNLNATIGLTQIKRYGDLLERRKKNYELLKARFKLLGHDDNSSYYFATTLLDEANKIIEKNGFARHYPMLHKAKYYETQQRLPFLESVHSKILNLPLHCQL